MTSMEGPSYRTVSLEDRCSFKKPKKLFLYCNGDQYSKVKPVHINPHKYRDFNDLLTDLTNKLPSNSRLTYGVRQIFTPVTGRKIKDLTQLNDGRNIVCAGFESFKPINYGEDITMAWSNAVNRANEFLYASIQTWPTPVLNIQKPLQYHMQPPHGYPRYQQNQPQHNQSNQAHHRRASNLTLAPAGYTVDKHASNFETLSNRKTVRVHLNSDKTSQCVHVTCYKKQQFKNFLRKVYRAFNGWATNVEDCEYEKIRLCSNKGVEITNMEDVFAIQNDIYVLQKDKHRSKPIYLKNDNKDLIQNGEEEKESSDTKDGPGNKPPTQNNKEVKTRDNDKTVLHQTDQQQQNKSFLRKTSSQTDREHSKPKVTTRKVVLTERPNINYRHQNSPRHKLNKIQENIEANVEQHILESSRKNDIEDILYVTDAETKLTDKPQNETHHHKVSQKPANNFQLTRDTSEVEKMKQLEREKEEKMIQDVKSGKLLIKNKMSHKIKRLDELDNRAADYNNLVGVSGYENKNKMFSGKKMASSTADKNELAEVHVNGESMKKIERSFLRRKSEQDITQVQNGVHTSSEIGKGRKKLKRTNSEGSVERVTNSKLKTMTKINLPSSNKTATISKPSTTSQSVLTPASQMLTLTPPPPTTTTTAAAPTTTLLKTNSKKLNKSSPIRTSNVDSANLRRQQYTTMAVHKSKQQRQISAVKRIQEKYEFLEILGDGNFAVVRRARKLGHNLELAVKVIDKSKLKGKEDMLENEICLMKLCDHANIVKLFEEFETFSEIYLVMELVKGGDLFDLISLHTKFDEWTCSLMVYDLTSALYYLHSRSIVHRDMKPENILVHNRSNGSISLKLADFGLAMVVDGPLLIVCGTPTYVAPEILLEQGYGLPIDMWALGVISYILLCGFPPFRSPDRNQSELFEAIKLGVFEFLSPYWDDVSAEPRSLIEKLLVVDPTARYTAIDVLCHPFITSSISQHHPNHPNNYQDVERLRRELQTETKATMEIFRKENPDLFLPKMDAYFRSQ